MLVPPIKLVGPTQRDYARKCITEAPQDSIVTIKDATRTEEQNRKMWAMLGDVSRAEPMGRKHTDEDWKSIFMRALKYEIRFVQGLDDDMFPVGMRSSQLTIKQMSELIEYMLWFGAEYDIVWSEPWRIEK